jgi:hypothetical protein
VKEHGLGWHGLGKEKAKEREKRGPTRGKELGRRGEGGRRPRWGRKERKKEKRKRKGVLLFARKRDKLIEIKA